MQMCGAFTLSIDLTLFKVNPFKIAIFGSAHDRFLDQCSSSIHLNLQFLDQLMTDFLINVSYYGLA